MKILHYSLGFPPYRSGGLTKFCVDIMEEQHRLGHEVALLWPGEMLFWSKKTRIRQNNDVNGIRSYEIINPLPVSYDEGIKNIDAFTNPGNSSCYEIFLENIKPDVVHIHTLMGLHSSFLNACKDIGIKLIFSAHDFYPICPKVTMFRKGHVCDGVSNCEDCPECNSTGLNIWKIKLLQSRMYRGLKNTKLLKRLRKNHRDNFLSGEKEKKINCSNNATNEDYMKLRQHYEKMLEQVDIVHFNSMLTKDIYEQYMSVSQAVVIPIIHSDITDKRKVKIFKDNELRITYLGPYSQAKGFFLLKDALDELWKERQDFRLNVFFCMENKPPYIITHERYGYQDLEDIFDHTDVSIVPSTWYETFGFTALESISYGVPVIITKNVGAKDILPKGGGVIMENITLEGIKKAISELTAKNLQDMNKCILENATIHTITKMTNEIIENCYEG